MWHERQLETAEAYALATVGALQGFYKYFIKDKIMELRLNNQSYTVEDLSEQAREDLARTIAFNRDAAVGQLAVLGFPEDHPYEPAELPPLPEPRQKPKRDSYSEYRGISLGH